MKKYLEWKNKNKNKKKEEEDDNDDDYDDRTMIEHTQK